MRVDPEDRAKILEYLATARTAAAHGLPRRTRLLAVRSTLIKRILALPGQSVCRNERTISVDGMEMGTMLAHDWRGGTARLARV